MKLKNILITGGNGFLGSVIKNKLSKDNNIITTTSRENDLTIENNVHSLFHNNNIDSVIHCAAFHGGIKYNIDNRAIIISKNLRMNNLLFEYSSKHKIEKLSCISTVDIYSRQCRVPLNENDIWNGYPEETSAPYAMSKKIMLVLSEAYKTQFGLNSINLLLINLYGPNDEFKDEKSHVIPSLIKKIDRAVNENIDEIEVWGDGSAKREFIYVDDAADYIIDAHNNYNKIKPLNIGSGQVYSIKELVHMLLEIMNADLKIKWNNDMPTGYPVKAFDMDYTYKNLETRAKTEFYQGLKNTVDWYYNNKK